MITYNRLGIHGRFGNQLFQIASTIGMAVKCDVSYGFPQWKYQDYFVNKLPGINHQNCSSLSGYLQDYRNFEYCEDLIRHYFTMKDMSVKKLENTIFIHFRAYSVEGVDRIHPEQDSEYYQKAITYFHDKNFVVFTDDIQRAKKVIQLDCPFRKGPEMEDFYLMSKCDGGIISNSSFSWWAGWLCRGLVIIPKLWFSGRQANYSTDGYYLQNWIAI